MKRLVTLLALSFSPLAAQAEVQTPPILLAQDVDLKEFLWTARPVIVFADSANDPRFIEQMRLLADRPEALADRDVVVITDTSPTPQSDLRKKLRPRGFMLVLIGKDGGVKLRKPFPWDIRELTRVIDKMPMRQQEIRDRPSLGQ